MVELENVLIRAEDHGELLQVNIVIIIFYNKNELDVMKLELNNRETSFNKIFGSNPLVGTINPVNNTSGINGVGKKKTDMSINRKLPPLPKATKGLFTNQLRPNSTKL